MTYGLIKIKGNSIILCRDLVYFLLYEYIIAFGNCKHL